jgi:integrase
MDANSYLSQVDVELTSGSWVAPNEEKVEKQVNMTLASMFDEYIEYRSMRGAPLRESTKELYERQLYKLLSSFAHRPLIEISQSDVSNWYLKKVGEGHVTSASKGYKLLKAMFSHAIRKGYLDKNVCDIPGAQSASTGKETETPNPLEVDKIVQHFPEKYRFAVVLKAYAALRFGELTELRRKDIEFSEVDGLPSIRVHVQRAVALVRGKFVVGEPKSKMSKRSVEVSSSLIGLFEEHLRNFVGSHPEALLFPNDSGDTHLPHHKFIRLWNRALKESGLGSKKSPPHSMRHFGATELHRQGANVAELKSWLGDSSTDAVSRYMHVTDRTQAIANSMRLAGSLEKIIREPK